MEMLTSNPKCNECGYIHPPTPPGKCPISRAQTDKGTKISAIVQEISDYLYEQSKDLERDITAFRKLLYALKNQK